MSADEEMPDVLPSTTEEETGATSNNPEGNVALDVVEVKPPATAAAADDYIRLRVITSEATNEVHFRVKAATALGRMKRSYCSKLGLQADELRFVFDGHRITDEDTPRSLGLMNDDVIEIYQERIGGGM